MIETMKQALEALEYKEQGIVSGEKDLTNRAITSLRQAIAEAEKQEPVASAWMHKGEMVNAFPWPPNDPRGCDEDKYWKDKGYTAEPLYTTPQPKQEPVAWCVLEPWLSGKFEAQDCFSDVALDANVGWVPLYTHPQPKQEQGEPVAYVDDAGVIVVCSYKYKVGDKLYTTPQPKRGPLTDEQIEALERICIDPVDANGWGFLNRKSFARAIEAAHGIK